MKNPNRTISNSMEVLLCEETCATDKIVKISVRRFV
jgi:hypothetical protein